MYSVNRKLLLLCCSVTSLFILLGCSGGWGGGSASRQAPASAPAAPTGVQAQGGTGFIQLDWADSPDPDVVYSVYRSTSQSGAFTLLRDDLPNSSYTDTSVGSRTYYYVVTCVNEEGVESPTSFVVSATPEDLPAEPPAAPTGLTAQGGPGSVQLDWSNNAESGVTYSVYRSTSEDGTYSLARSGISASNFTDFGLAPGTYYYVVTAVGSGGLESESSAIASATAEEPPPSDFEGFGKVTRGAESSPDGFQVYHVTSVADSGAAGTLRDAIRVQKRYIVFDVAGTITLGSSLRLNKSYITIDGFSAPPPGITILSPRSSGYSAVIEPSDGSPVTDVVIRGLRCDWQSEGLHTGSGDIWALTGGSTGISRVVLDRMTCYGAPDGIFDFWGTASDISITRCLIGRTSTALNCISGSSSQGRDRITIAHNLFTHNTDRQPRINHRTWDLDMVQNIIYGWAWHEGMDGSTIFVNDGALHPKANVEDNWFIYVAGLNGGPDDAIRIDAGCEIYLAGNSFPPQARAVSTGPRVAIPAHAQVPRITMAQILSEVGAPYRTAADQALIDEVQFP